MNEIELWEKQEPETAKSFAAFLAYRNIATKERSIKKAIQKMYGAVSNPDTKQRQWEGWSSKFNWVQRAIAWDSYQDNKRREEELQAIKDMKEKHIKLAQALIQTAVKRLTTMDPIELSANDTLSFIEAGVKLERISRGEPDNTLTINNTFADIDFTLLDTGTLRQQLLEKIKALPQKQIIDL